MNYLEVFTFIGLSVLIGAIFICKEIPTQLADSRLFDRMKNYLKFPIAPIFIILISIYLYSNVSDDIIGDIISSIAHLLENLKLLAIYLATAFGIILMYTSTKILKATCYLAAAVVAVNGILVYHFNYGISILYLLGLIGLVPLCVARRQDFKKVLNCTWKLRNKSLSGKWRIVCGVGLAICAGVLFATSDAVMFIIGDLNSHLIRFLIQELALVILIQVRDHKKTEQRKEKRFLPKTGILICAVIVCMISGLIAGVKAFIGITPLFFPFFKYSESYASILATWIKDPIREQLKKLGLTEKTLMLKKAANGQKAKTLMNIKEESPTIDTFKIKRTAKSGT